MTKTEILKALNIENLPAAKRDEIITRLENLIKNRVALKISKLYPDIDMSENMSDAEAGKILRDKIPTLSSIIKDTATETVRDFLRKFS